MTTPETQPELPEVTEVMWMVRYQHTVAGRRQDKLPWYRTTDIENLDGLESEELRLALRQQKEDIESGSPRITRPTAYADGQFSHLHTILRDTFEIPGGLSLRPVSEAKPITVTTAGETRRLPIFQRIAGLLGRHRNENN